MTKKCFMVALLAAAGAATGSAALLNCAGISNIVTQLDATNSCFVTGSPLTFSNFTVSPGAGFTGATVGIGASFTQYVGGVTYLDFQIGGILGPGAPMSGDIILTYQVNGPLNGLDIDLQATPGNGGGSISVFEIACKVPVSGGSCPLPNSNTLANFSATSSGFTDHEARTFATQTSTWIYKDIQFNNAGMSDFVNSHSSPVPEPVTISLVGAGLLGLGLIRRRVR
jgi:hypothetical protein